MKHYLFKVTLSGYGDSLQSAWDDAVEQFSQDPGSPDDEEYTVEDEDDEIKRQVVELSAVFPERGQSVERG